MAIENEGPAPQPQHDEAGVENTEESTKQPPGYNEVGRGNEDTSGETNEMEPAWRPGEDPAGEPLNAGMQGEGEPGRSERDSTGGVEGTVGQDE
jgi:hypothetical protein